MASTGTMISVVLIEDNRLVREGITALLNELPDFKVITGRSTAADIGLLVEETAQVEGTAQVFLLGLGARNGDSVRMVEAVKAEVPAAKIVVMDVQPGQEEIVQYVKAGVEGFIMKDATIEELAATIRLVAGGGKMLPPQMTGSLFAQMASSAVTNGRPGAGGAVARDLGRTTAREGQVVDLIKEGLSNKEIAKRLHISTHTVKSHVRNIMDKLAMHTRLQISAFAHGERS